MWQLILDQRERCGEWARERIPNIPTLEDCYQAIIKKKDGELVAVVVFNLYSGADVAMHIAAVPGRRWMTRQFLRAAFRYPFLQLGCRRVSGYVPVTNLEAQRFDEHLGFVREGLMREALPNGEDVIVYGMLERESRWHR